MRKPIEPGCLALVVSGNNAGECCWVVCWVEPGETFHAYGGVSRNSTGKGGWGVEFKDGWGVFYPSALRRIDDYDNTEITEKEAELTQ